MPRIQVPAGCAVVFFASITLPQAIAQAPLPLLLPVHAPAAAVDWEAAERARNPMIVESRFVRLSTEAIAAVRTTGAAPLATMAVELFGEDVSVEITSSDWTLARRVLRGRVVGHDGDALLAIGGDGIAWGSFDVDAASYVLASTGVADVHVLQRIDQTLLPAANYCGCDASHEVDAGAVSGPASLLPTANTDCDLTTIDVLVCYTPQARQNAGGVAAIEATIVGAIEQANSAHFLSGTDIQFRLVHAAETNYTELGTNTDLSRFRNSSDGYMDEVHTLRETYGADLMHLVIEPPTSAFCGIGYLMTNLSTGFESSAFAVTLRTCIANRTLTHECGHNMGCAHDRANAGSAVHPYAYGFRTSDDVYRTIMAYAPGTRINRWSSPNVVYNGYTMGVPNSEDNALSIDGVASTVAQFRQTRTLQWCQLGGGIAGAAGVPTLLGTGTIDLAEPISLLVNGQPFPPVGLLVIGASAVNVPIFGGTLVPSLDVTVPLTGLGSTLVYDASWLAARPAGFEAWFQAAFLDPTAAQGLSASDAVKVTLP